MRMGYDSPKSISLTVTLTENYALSEFLHKKLFLNIEIFVSFSVLNFVMIII
jgi:hypothetical protein